MFFSENDSLALDEVDFDEPMETEPEIKEETEAEAAPSVPKVEPKKEPLSPAPL